MNTARNVPRLPITAGNVASLPSPDDDTPAQIAADNYRRACRAAVAVKSYAQITHDQGESPGSVMVDLLCDLMHLADCLDLDFADLANRAGTHYAPELRGEL